MDFAIRRGPSPCCGSTWVWEPAGSRTAGSPRSPCSLPHTRPSEPGRRVPCLRAPPADLPGTASAPSAPRLPPSSCHGTWSSRPLAVSLSLHPPPTERPVLVPTTPCPARACDCWIRPCLAMRLVCACPEASGTNDRGASGFKHLLALEAGSLRSRGRQGPAPSGGHRAGPPLSPRSFLARGCISRVSPRPLLCL